MIVVCQEKYLQFFGHNGKEVKKIEKMAGTAAVCYGRGGFLGSVAATFGVVLPSFIIIYLISLFFDSLLEVQLIANAFRGIQVGVGFIIVQAGLKLKKKMKDTKLAKGIFYLSVAVMLAVEIFSINFSTMTLMVLVGVFCAALCFVQNRKGAEK